MITVMVQIKTRASEHQRFLDAARTLRKASREEEGNVEYSLWIADGEEPGVLVVERYRDRAALDAHHQAPHLAEFRAAVKGAVAAAPTSDRWESGDEAS